MVLFAEGFQVGIQDFRLGGVGYHIFLTSGFLPHFGPVKWPQLIIFQFSAHKNLNLGDFKGVGGTSVLRVRPLNLSMVLRRFNGVSDISPTPS